MTGRRDAAAAERARERARARATAGDLVDMLAVVALLRPGSGVLALPAYETLKREAWQRAERAIGTKLASAKSSEWDEDMLCALSAEFRVHIELLVLRGTRTALLSTRKCLGRAGAQVARATAPRKWGTLHLKARADGLFVLDTARVHLGSRASRAMHAQLVQRLRRVGVAWRSLHDDDADAFVSPEASNKNNNGSNNGSNTRSNNGSNYESNSESKSNRNHNGESTNKLCYGGGATCVKKGVKSPRKSIKVPPPQVRGKSKVLRRESKDKVGHIARHALVASNRNSPSNKARILPKSQHTTATPVASEFRTHTTNNNKDKGVDGYGGNGHAAAGAAGGGECAGGSGDDGGCGGAGDGSGAAGGEGRGDGDGIWPTKPGYVAFTRVLAVAVRARSFSTLASVLVRLLAPATAASGLVPLSAVARVFSVLSGRVVSVAFVEELVAYLQCAYVPAHSPPLRRNEYIHARLFCGTLASAVFPRAVPAPVMRQPHDISRLLQLNAQLNNNSSSNNSSSNNSKTNKIKSQFSVKPMPMMPASMPVPFAGVPASVPVLLPSYSLPQPEVDTTTATTTATTTTAPIEAAPTNIKDVLKARLVKRRVAHARSLHLRSQLRDSLLQRCTLAAAAATSPPLV